MKIIFPVIFLLSYAVLLGAQPALHDKDIAPLQKSRLTLEAVDRAVLQDNPSVKEAHAKWEAMKQRVPQARAWEDPKLSVSSRIARFVAVPPNGFTDQMLSVEQMIPLTGKNKSRSRIAAIEAMLMFEDVRRKEFDALAKARAAFHRLSVTYALLELNSADETSLRQTAESARAKFETGGTSQADLLVAENELVKIGEARQDLLQKISADETQLCVLMGRDPFRPLGQPADDKPDFHKPSIDRFRSLINSNRPEVRQAEAGLSLAKEKLNLANKEKYPDPSLSVQGQRYNAASQAVSEIGVGISVSIPLFNGKKYRAMENEAASGVEAAQSALAVAQLEALGMLRDQLKKIETARHHVELYRDSLLPTARQAVDAGRSTYETGKSGLMELITSQRSLRELQSMSQQHLGDYQAAVDELEAIVGSEHREFSPPVETIKRKKP